MGEVSVRRADPADAEVVGRLLHEFNSEFGEPEPGAEAFARRFRSLLESVDQLVLLAEDGDDTVGFAYLTFRRTPYFDGPLGQLEELYVRPDRRDQRIGTALMEAALADARGRGAGEMHINVDEVDTDTRRFYEQRFGFTNVAPGEDYRMLFYEREL